MTAFSPSILDYWHKVFADGVILAGDAAFSITVNPTLGDQRQAMILEDASGHARAAIMPALANKMAIHETQTISKAELRHLLANADAALHDPDLIFYLPNKGPQERTGKQVTECRQLSEADRQAFDLFQATASQQDLDDAYVELHHWAVFGVFEGDLLVSAASIYPWGNGSIADLGVLTLPDFRGRGHGCVAVQAISQFARRQGYEPQYRCQLDNTGSVALAKSSGFIFFGKWEVSVGALDADAS
jgi:RimJ/RimL family protein N-acetyltransferase